MRKLIYFTGQRELEKTSVRLETAIGADGTTRCSGTIDSLPGGLPEGSVLVLEAWNSMYLHRIELGDAKAPCRFEDKVLERLPANAPVTFRVKIVFRDAEGSPVLFAARDGIKTLSEEAQGESILPVRGKTDKELGGELWRVEKSQLGNGNYELWVNSEAGTLLASVKGGETSLLGLMLPMAVRTILHQLFAQGDNCASDEVRGRWLQMAESEFGMERVDPSTDDDESNQAVLDWVERFVECLCRKHAFAASYARQKVAALGSVAQ